MKTSAQKTSFIARGRNLAKQMSEFQALLEEYTATDAGNVIVDADFVDINAGLTTGDMINFISSVVTPVVSILETAGVNTVVETYKNV